METRDLPGSYGDSTVVLLVQTPRVVYAYWEITPVAWHTLTRRGVFTLRFWEGDPGAHRDVYPDRRAGGWYFRDVKPGVLCFCEVGCTEQGAFYPFLRSAPVTTPFDTAAPVEGCELVTPAFDQAPGALPLPGSGEFYT
ncbi:MAG: DUF4912 domain-containing protein [Desulfotomaculales bacterium]